MPTNDANFQKHRSLVAVVFVGAFLGYLLANAANSFFLPTWLLALGGGGIGGYTGGSPVLSVFRSALEWN